MIKNLRIVPLLSTVLFASNNFIQSQYTSLKQGTTQDQVISLFGKAEHKKSFLDGDLDIEAGITGFYAETGFIHLYDGGLGRIYDLAKEVLKFVIRN